MARTLVIACGALAHELMAVLRANAWEHVDVTCLPAHWHNTPARIVPGVEERIVAARATHERVLVAYGDCGTGGQLDAMLARHGAERLPRRSLLRLLHRRRGVRRARRARARHVLT